MEHAVARHRANISTARNAIEMILIKEESNVENRRCYLPGQAEGGEPGDFHLATFMDADFGQLLAEIGWSVTVAEKSKNLIATCTERHIAWLSLIETPKDGEVEASTDFLPETFPVLFGSTIAPNPILTFGEFVFSIAAEQAETWLWGLLVQALDQSQQAVCLLHGLASGKGFSGETKNTPSAARGSTRHCKPD